MQVPGVPNLALLNCLKWYFMVDRVNLRDKDTIYDAKIRDDGKKCAAE